GPGDAHPGLGRQRPVGSDPRCRHALPEKAPESGPISDWDRFLDQVVGPYLVPDIEKEQEKMVAGVDRAIAGMMNAILHHPDFHNLEARWRGLRWIVRRLETGEQLQIDLLDLTRAEFSASLTGNDDLADTSIYKKLATAGAAEGGQTPWSLMLGLYDFAKTRADAVILARAGALGQALNAAFVAAADGSVIHCRNLAEAPDPADWTATATGTDAQAWQVMRGLSEAAWVGLAMPRFLIRLPYGVDTDPVDAFDFEEMPETPIHENYLWAHPAFAVALVMGRSFAQSGWHFMHHLENHIAGLPLHVYTSDGERTLSPCCEVPLGERALQQMIASGVLPLIGLQGRDQAVLPRLRSLAMSDTPLAGPW
ncbi:type VI secretion system contractile sheath domain-containing protein, partial [Desulfosarcina cetonica]|uniref:type VI secretion system contractile sheath domain-containing protein n=1 Tax=Desulfosarcina cetonica TaxID=90730 RepID=UPI00155DAF83